MNLLTEEVRKNTLPHLSKQADLFGKRPPIRAAQLLTPDPAEEQLCWTLLHPQQRRSTQARRERIAGGAGVTPHLQCLPSASENLPRDCNCLWMWAVPATKGRRGVGAEAFPASCWQTIYLSN